MFVNFQKFICVCFFGNWFFFLLWMHELGSHDGNVGEEDDDVDDDGDDDDNAVHMILM